MSRVGKIHRHITVAELRAIAERAARYPDNWTICVKDIGEERYQLTRKTARHPQTWPVVER